MLGGLEAAGVKCVGVSVYIGNACGSGDPGDPGVGGWGIDIRGTSGIALERGDDRLDDELVS
jgi:hypothetical protein